MTECYNEKKNHPKDQFYKRRVNYDTHAEWKKIFDDEKMTREIHAFIVLSSDDQL